MRYSAPPEASPYQTRVPSALVGAVTLGAGADYLAPPVTTLTRRSAMRSSPVFRATIARYLGAAERGKRRWCVGRGGFGIQTAPAASRLAARLLLRRELDSDLERIDPQLYSPARF